MYGGYGRRPSLLKRIVRRFRHKKCDHVWGVYGATMADEPVLLASCETCGLHGTVPNPAEDEWNSAFVLNGERIDWPDASSVVIDK